MNGSPDPSTPAGGRLFADIVAVALVVLTAAILHHAFFMSPKAGGLWNATLYSADQMEYADLGREIYRGEGFTTQLLYPPSLVKAPRLPHPNLIRPPLYPLTIAGGFLLSGGPSDQASAVISFLFYLATVAITYTICRRFAGFLWSVLAALCVACMPLFMAAGGAGLSEALAAFLLTCAIGLAAGKRHPFLAGIFLGLAYLTRYQFLPLLLPFAVYVITPALARSPDEPPSSTGRWRYGHAVLLFVGFILAALPWWVRNATLTGSPFFSLVSFEMVHHTATFPGSPFYGRTDSISPFLFALTHPGEMAQKILHFTFYWGDAQHPPGSVFELLRQLGPVAVLLLLLAFVSRATRGFAAFIAATVLFQLALFGLGHFEARYLVPMLPGLLIAGFAAAGEAARSQPPKWLPALAAIVIIAGTAAWNVGIAAPRVFTGIQYNTWWLDAPAVDWLKKNTAESEAILTNIPWSVAWQCDRPAVAPVERPEDLEVLLSLDGIRIGSVYRDAKLGFRHEDEILNSTDFKRHYYLKERLPNGGIFWTWKEEGEDWLNVELPFLAWDALEERPVTLDLMLRDPQRWDDAIYGMRDAAERVRDFELTSDGLGLMVLLDDGSVLAAGNAVALEGIPGATNAVQIALLTDTSGAILYASGTVRVFGGAKHHGNMENVLDSACDIDFTENGEGYLILNRFGQVGAFGKTPQGKTPVFGWQVVVALEPSRRSQGWYVLDAFGAIHKSRPTMSDHLGPYHPQERIARDFLISPKGLAYVLTTDGSIHTVQSKVAAP